MDFKRARSAEQKAVRSNQIIEAALALYDEMPYSAITLSAITEKLDFTRANLRKYFATKEEIFLIIIERDTIVWTDELRGELSKHDTITIQKFSGLWASSLYKHKRLLELLSILNTVIEKNVSVESLAVWRKAMNDCFKALNKQMLRIIPGMTSDLGHLFFDFQMHYAVGLYPATAQNEIQKKAAKVSGVPYKKEGFVPAFSKFLAIALQGLILQINND